MLSPTMMVRGDGNAQGRTRRLAAVRRICASCVLAVLAGCRSEAVPPTVPSEDAAEVAAAEGPVPSEPFAAPEAVEPEPGVEPEPAVEPEPEPPAPIPAPTLLCTAEVFRESKSGKPPWSRVEIEGLRFGLRPTPGETVTIVPRDPALPVLELSIVNVRTHGAPRDGIPRWWEPVLAKVEDRAYFELRAPRDRRPEYPADVVVVYPATPSAVLLDPKAVSPDDLPPGVLPKGVELAVDVDGDGRPDAIESTVCTENPKKAKCFEATAWEVHRREGDGWQLVHRFEPAT